MTAFGFRVGVHNRGGATQVVAPLLLVVPASLAAALNWSCTPWRSPTGRSC